MSQLTSCCGFVFAVAAALLGLMPAFIFCKVFAESAPRISLGFVGFTEWPGIGRLRDMSLTILPLLYAPIGIAISTLQITDLYEIE